MSWTLLGISLVIAYLLQTTVLGVVGAQLFGMQPFDLLLALALTAALLMPRDDARLAGLAAGFAADFAGTGAFGVHAFAFGVGALVLTAWRDAVRLDIWFVRLPLACGAAIAAEWLLAAHMAYWQGSNLSLLTLLARGTVVAILAAVIATILAGGASGLRRRRVLRRRAARHL